MSLYLCYRSFRMSLLALGLLAIGLLCSLPVLATEPDAEPDASDQATTDQPDTDQPDRVFAEEVTVTGTREERTVTEVPGSVAVVSQELLRQSRGESLGGALASIPGVSAQSNNGASDVKLSIRGFGARSTFGVRDVLVLIDGVPITDADGFTRLDQIDLTAAERVEVVKGPASALYGNAAFGGVVNVITRHGDLLADQIRLRGEAGDLGFSKALASISGGSPAKRLGYALHVSRSELTGFRDHNDNEVRRINGTLDWFSSDRTTVRTLLNMSQLRDELPGSLNRQQFESDPSQVRPFFELFDWRRDDDRYRLGAVVEHVASPRSDLEARLFLLTRDLDHPIFQVIDQEGLRTMGGVRYGRNFGTSGDTSGKDHRLIAGVDFDREDVDSQRFVNVFGEPGALTLSADEVIENVGVYLQDEIELAPEWSLTVGGRWDRIRFEETDRLQQPVDLSDERDFEKISPKLAVLWQPTPEISAFLNLATAFQVPTKAELSAAVGDTGFNRDLEPQKARHTEIGVRGVSGRRLRWEASVFRTDVDDEILPRTVVQNTTIFGNVGETRHQGVELAMDIRLPLDLELGLGYGWSDNEFIGFTDENGVVLDGNVIPGHPEHRGTVRISTRRLRGLNGSLLLERVGSVFLDDANLETHRPYSLLHGSLRWDWERFSVFVRGTNLTDEPYAAWISVNDPQGNFFLPAPGRSFTAGFDVSF